MSRCSDLLVRSMLAVGLLAAAGAVYWYGVGGGVGRRTASPPSPQEAPVTYPSGLVGTARCAECHADQAAAHAASGHSRTFHRTRDSAIALSLCSQVVERSGVYGRFEYACDEEGLLVGIPEFFGGRLFPLDFALGSGDHAVTFLTLQPSLQGETIGIEHRYTWYRSRNGLGLTPSHEHTTPGIEIEYFGKAYDEATARRCIGCHTTAYEIQEHQLRRVVAGVQCERCHGPGERHVAAVAGGRTDAAGLEIDVPRTAAEEIALCGRCHRMPNDVAPERLERYPPSLTRFQPIGLLRSRCYLESDGRLRCSTCHDPHAPVTSRSREEQTASCRECHDGRQGSLCRELHETRCIDCHMRRMELIPGIHFYDHWIRARLPTSDPAEPPTQMSGDPHAPLPP